MQQIHVVPAVKQAKPQSLGPICPMNVNGKSDPILMPYSVQHHRVVILLLQRQMKTYKRLIWTQM